MWQGTRLAPNPSGHPHGRASYSTVHIKQSCVFPLSSDECRVLVLVRPEPRQRRPDAARAARVAAIVVRNAPMAPLLHTATEPL
nr:hypothetical protein CFP56_69496 [Quercus suber]